MFTCYIKDTKKRALGQGIKKKRSDLRQGHQGRPFKELNTIKWKGSVWLVSKEENM